MYRVLMQCGVAWCSVHSVCSSAPLLLLRPAGPIPVPCHSSLGPTLLLLIACHASQVHVDAAGASFRGASLFNSDFSHSNLVGAAFDGADVSGASFAHSNLRGASFVGAHGLETADFTDALARP